MALCEKHSDNADSWSNYMLPRTKSPISRLPHETNTKIAFIVESNINMANLW